MLAAGKKTLKGETITKGSCFTLWGRIFKIRHKTFTFLESYWSNGCSAKKLRESVRFPCDHKPQQKTLTLPFQQQSLSQSNHWTPKITSQQQNGALEVLDGTFHCFWWTKLLMLSCRNWALKVGFSRVKQVFFSMKKKKINLEQALFSWQSINLKTITQLNSVTCLLFYLFKPC